MSQLTNAQLLSLYQNPKGDADKQMALVEMARRTGLMRMFTDAICRPQKERHATEVSIVSVFQRS